MKSFHLIFILCFCILNSNSFNVEQIVHSSTRDFLNHNHNHNKRGQSNKYKAIIHIGPHKTASTDLQQNLVGNYGTFKRLFKVVTFCNIIFSCSHVFKPIFFSFGWNIIGKEGVKFGTIFANYIRGGLLI
jgi:hypothetical protein